MADQADDPHQLRFAIAAGLVVDAAQLHLERLDRHAARRRNEEAPAPAQPAPPPEDVALLREIRDLLKK